MPVSRIMLHILISPKNDTWHSVYELKRLNVRKRDVFEWCDELSQNASKNAIHNMMP